MPAAYSYRGYTVQDAQYLKGVNDFPHGCLLFLLPPAAFAGIALGMGTGKSNLGLKGGEISQ